MLIAVLAFHFIIFTMKTLNSSAPTLRPCTRYHIHFIAKSVIFNFKVADFSSCFQEKNIVGIVEIFGELNLDKFESFSSSLIKKIIMIYPCQKFEFWHTNSIDNGSACCTRIAETYTADVLNTSASG